MKRIKDLEFIAREAQSMLDNAKSTGKTISKNGVSFNSLKAAVNGAGKAYNQGKRIRGRFGRGGRGRRNAPPGRGRPVGRGRGKRGGFVGRRGKSRVPPRHQSTRPPMAVANDVAKSLLSSQRTHKNETALHKNMSIYARSGHIVHEELVTQIYATASVIIPQAFYIGPYNQALCPYLSGFARMYAKARPGRLRIHYTGTCGTNTQGSIYMGCSFDFASFNLPSFSDVSKIATLDNGPDPKSFAVYESASFSIDISKFAKGSDLQVNQNNPSSVPTSDQVNYWGCILIIATDSSFVGAVGNLWYEYEWQFNESILPVQPDDFYTNNPSDVNDPLTGAGNVSTIGYTSLAIVTFDSAQRTGIQFNANFQGLMIIRVVGTGFTADPSEETVVYTPAASDGTVQIYNTSGSTTDQTSIWYIVINANSVINMSPDTAPTTLDLIQVTILGGHTDVTTSQENVSLLLSNQHHIQVPKYIPTPRQFVVDYNDRIGDPEAIHEYICGVEKLFGRRRDRKALRINFDEKVDEFDGESLEKIDKISNGKGTIYRSGSEKNCHRNKSDRDDVFLIFILTILTIVQAQIPPFTTSTARPTGTKFPTPSPVSQNPRLGRVDYNLGSLANGETVFGNPLTGYLETSPHPILAIHNSTTLRYVGRVTPPVNITVVFTMSEVIDGYYGMKSAGTPTKVIGRACVLSQRQTSWFFWMVGNNADIFLSFNIPLDADVSQGMFYAAYVNNIPGFESGTPIIGPTNNPTAMLHVM